MDACFFRFLGPAVGAALQGVRIDTVYGPGPGYWTIAFSHPFQPAPGLGDCRFLLLRVHSRLGALLLSPVKPVNPPAPPAKAMWLRKHAAGRKLKGGVTDWPRRRLALKFADAEGGWLLLGMEQEPTILEYLPEDFIAQPDWPDAVAAAQDPACPRSLRRALDREDPQDRDRLLRAFLAGEASGFYLDPDDPTRHGPLPWPPGRQSVRYGHALEAALAHGQAAFFSALAPADDSEREEKARAKRRAALLDKDRARLAAMTGQHAFGEAVAASLADLNPREKYGPRELEHPELGRIAVPLDPSLTLLENMEKFFRKAAKGRRGQVHVERLKVEAEEGRLPARKAPVREAPREGKPRAKTPSVPLHRFRSSDGFVILRGRNSAANHRLLSEVASPFDYWFHAEGGPGAHVILRRDSPGREVPSRSMEEAAAIAALASWRAADAKADILVAQVSEVRKIKGAALGRVRLDSARTLRVSLDPSIEDALRDDS